MNGETEAEVRRSIGSFVKKSAAMKHEGSMADAKFLKKPGVCDTRVEYKGARSRDLPTGLELEQDNRKLGIWYKTNQKHRLNLTEKRHLAQTR